MCNEAAAHLCQIHPLLLVADRADRLEAAQSVVRKVERETQQTQRCFYVTIYISTVLCVAARFCLLSKCYWNEIFNA